MVWTQESQSFVWFDRPGESSPEKDCCWWHWHWWHTVCGSDTDTRVWSTASVPYVLQSQIKWKHSETGPPVRRPYARKLESPTIYRCYSKGSTFSSIILTPRLGIEPGAYRSKIWYSTKWANQSATVQINFTINFISIIAREASSIRSFTDYRT